MIKAVGTVRCRAAVEGRPAVGRTKDTKRRRVCSACRTITLRSSPSRRGSWVPAGSRPAANQRTIRACGRPCGNLQRHARMPEREPRCSACRTLAHAPLLNRPISANGAHREDDAPHGRGASRRCTTAEHVGASSNACRRPPRPGDQRLSSTGLLKALVWHAEHTEGFRQT